jgi:hypothetical protein
VQLHFTTRVRYGFLSVQLNYTIRRQMNYRGKLDTYAYWIILAFSYAVVYSFNKRVIEQNESA